MVLYGLAVAWVKVGLPPADGWVRDAVRGSPAAYVLSAGAGLPVLGGYLLYRLRPLVLAVQGEALLLGLAVIALGWALLRRSAPWGARLLDVTAALMIGLVATTLPAWYLLILALARVALLAAAILAAPSLLLKMPHVLAEDIVSGRGGTGAVSAHDIGRLEGWGQRAINGIRDVACIAQREHTGLLSRNLAWAYAGIGALIALGMAFSAFG
jgi:hypothetical protein